MLKILVQGQEVGTIPFTDGLHFANNEESFIVQGNRVTRVRTNETVELQDYSGFDRSKVITVEF